MTELQLKEQVLRMSGVNPLKCMRCGKCSGTCPSYNEMEYHPHQFVQMVENGILEPLLNSKSIYWKTFLELMQYSLSYMMYSFVKFFPLLTFMSLHFAASSTPLAISFSFSLFLLHSETPRLIS